MNLKGTVWEDADWSHVAQDKDKWLDVLKRVLHVQVR
jgi:hypothetical protein